MKKVFFSFRFIAIAYPYHYHANWDRKKSRCIIILFWLFTVLWTLCGLWDWGTNSIKTLEIFTVTVSQGRCVNTNTLFYVSSYGIYVSGVLVMTICYVFILKVAIQHIKAIHSTTSTTMQSERKINSKTHRRNKEWKATKSMAIVYFSFLFCWFPLLIINVIISIDKMFFYKMLLENEDLFLFIYYTFIVILPSLNFMINPVIYSFTNKVSEVEWSQFWGISKYISSIIIPLNQQKHFINLVGHHQNTKLITIFQCKMSKTF